MAPSARQPSALPVCYSSLTGSMDPKRPTLDVFLCRQGDAWRLDFSPQSWRTPFLLHMDDHGVVFPVGRPDLDELDRAMWNADAPYEKRMSRGGGVQVVANGRSAIALVAWLTKLIEEGRRCVPATRPDDATDRRSGLDGS